MLVSVLTATIPGREEYLREACASVKAQTLRSREHLVRRDQMLEGQSKMLNALAADASGDYLLILNDDDILLPRALDLLVGHALETGAGVVYSPPLVWGEEPHQFTGDPPKIPCTALISREVWRPLAEDLIEREDNDLWTRMLESRVRFERFDAQPTWVYRFWRHPDGAPGNKSRRGGRIE